MRHSLLQIHDGLLLGVLLLLRHLYQLQQTLRFGCRLLVLLLCILQLLDASKNRELQQYINQYHCYMVCVEIKISHSDLKKLCRRWHLSMSRCPYLEIRNLSFLSFVFVILKYRLFIQHLRFQLPLRIHELLVQLAGGRRSASLRL